MFFGVDSSGFDNPTSSTVYQPSCYKMFFFFIVPFPATEYNDHLQQRPASPHLKTKTKTHVTINWLSNCPYEHDFQQNYLTEYRSNLQMSLFLVAPKHLYNWLCPLVVLSVGNAFVQRSTRRTLLAYLALVQTKNMSAGHWLTGSPDQARERHIIVLPTFFPAAAIIIFIASIGCYYGIGIIGIIGIIDVSLCQSHLICICYQGRGIAANLRNAMKHNQNTIKIKSKHKTLSKHSQNTINTCRFVDSGYKWTSTIWNHARFFFRCVHLHPDPHPGG